MVHLEAYHLLCQTGHGVLSTHSQKFKGYPFGSVTPYALDRQGCPVIYISDLAQHTKNILVHPQVALTLMEKGDAEDVQAQGRLTLLGEAQVVSDTDREDTASRYYRYLPAARKYQDFHDFKFYLLRPVQWRYIGGFGDIQWLEPERVQLSNPFQAKEEIMMVEHMNADHQVAMLHYLYYFLKQDSRSEAPVEMLGIDGYGCDLLYQNKRFRLPFETPVENVKAAREMLVKMARAGK